MLYHNNRYIYLSVYDKHCIVRIDLHVNTVLYQWSGGHGSTGHTYSTGATSRYVSIRDMCTISEDNGLEMLVVNDYEVVKVRISNSLVTQVAGGAGSSSEVDNIGTAARFLRPRQCYSPSNGDVYVSDLCTIRKVNVIARSVITFIGTIGNCGLWGFDVNPTLIRFGDIRGIIEIHNFRNDHE